MGERDRRVVCDEEGRGREMREGDAEGREGEEVVDGGRELALGE